MGDLIQLNMAGTRTGRLSVNDSDHDKRFRIMEIFGPVIQGEGLMLGQLTHFIRFGGCDSRCTWCDTKYAVEPELVIANAYQMARTDIVEALNKLDPCNWVTLSGGNPALFDLGPLVTKLKSLGYNVAVETQATINKPWLAQVNSLVLSPKPPSSGNELENFLVLDDLAMAPGASLKIVINVDEMEADLNFAEEVYFRYHAMPHRPPLFLQPMTTKLDGIGGQLASYDLLCRALIGRPRLHDALVRPRMHELIGMR